MFKSALFTIAKTWEQPKRPSTGERIKMWCTDTYTLEYSVQSPSCVQLCDPMDCSAPCFLVHHQLPELTQTHVHPVSDAIQPSLPSVIPFKCCIITVVIALQH